MSKPIKIQNIKEIILGPRQLTFGFDKNVQEEQNFILACILEQFETNGQVVLDQFIVQVENRHNLTEIDILQYIFWSAHELKIHFRVDGKNTLPFEAKQILLTTPEKRVELITNKMVEASVFQDVKSFFQNLFKKNHQNNFDDQYALACSLRSTLKNWKTRLDSFNPMAQKPFYPGSKKIQAHLQLLKILLARQDSYSIIYAYYTHKEKIVKMRADIKKMSTFYPRQIKFWGVLIKSMDVFRINLPEIKKSPAVFDGFNRLAQILESCSPYDLISEADRLLKMVHCHNDLIVQKKTDRYRIKALSKIDAMIEKLLVLFDMDAPDQDLRHRFLYALRSAKKKLTHTRTIKQIDLIVFNTEDLFDDFIDELQNS